jgi:outer membrane protein assembly factor BamB
MALHPESGEKLWEKSLGDKRVDRAVVVAGTLFVATQWAMDDPAKVLLFDLHTGAPGAEVEAGFRINTSLVKGDRVYFGGRGGLLGLTADGTVLFRATLHQVSETWRGRKFEVVMADGTGNVLWRTAHAEHAPSDGLLLLGDLAAQIDFTG